MKTQILQLKGKGNGHLLRYGIILLVGMWLILLLTGGCAAVSLVPVTFKEIKDYVSKQERSYAHPLRKVIISSGSTLKHLNFALSRMEFLGEQGMIQASAQGTRVTMRFDSVTPRLTRLRCKIVTKEGVRFFSSEEELFDHIRYLLDHGQHGSWRKVTTGMNAVFLKPNRKSRVVAYLAPGEKVTIVDDGDKWTQIDLLSGGLGYIPTKHLLPLGSEEKPSVNEDIVG